MSSGHASRLNLTLCHRSPLAASFTCAPPMLSPAATKRSCEGAVARPLSYDPFYPGPDPQLEKAVALVMQACRHGAQTKSSLDGLCAARA